MAYNMRDCLVSFGQRIRDVDGLSCLASTLTPTNLPHILPTLDRKDRKELHKQPKNGHTKQMKKQPNQKAMKLMTSLVGDFPPEL